MLEKDLSSLICERDRYGIIYLRDREPESEEYSGARIDVVHMDTFNGQNKSPRVQLVEERINMLHDAGVNLAEVGKSQSLDADLENLEQGEQRFLGGAIEQGCVLVRARVIMRNGGQAIIDRALTIPIYGKDIDS
jgi:hypothetical protein